MFLLYNDLEWKPVSAISCINWFRYGLSWPSDIPVLCGQSAFFVIISQSHGYFISFLFWPWNCQPWFVPSLFLRFGKIGSSCSYKIVLIKNSVLSQTFKKTWKAHSPIYILNILVSTQYILKDAYTHCVLSLFFWIFETVHYFL